AGKVGIPAHYPPNPRDIDPPPRPVEIHHAPPERVGASVPPAPLSSHCRRLTSDLPEQPLVDASAAATDFPGAAFLPPSADIR
uniref:Uncharacterized protein n=1 Tax=Oryza nivara TaxID=4536 RepID=A0A0E0H7W4_ORYNI